MTKSAVLRRERKLTQPARGVPTIADVAAVAGVAPMTVSRVINSRSHVRPETREVVQAAIAKLKYSPNLAARTLAGAQQVRVGMLYRNLGAAFLSELLVGSLEQASLSQVQLVIKQCDANQHEKEAVRELLQTGVDGVILPPPLCESKQMYAAIIDSGALAVAIASPTPRAGLLSVCIDDRAAAVAMTRHILSLGHTRIGFITGNPSQSASALRLRGYKIALAEAHIPIDNSLVRQGQFTYRSGLKAAEQLLSMAKPPSAIFASNDDMGAATIAVAHRRHLEVPKDLTVCGFDDTALSRSISPELTTIRQPIADMSRTAMLLLLKHIKARREGSNEHTESALLDFTLVHRESDGPPNSRKHPTLRAPNSAVADASEFTPRAVGAANGQLLDDEALLARGLGGPAQQRSTNYTLAFTWCDRKRNEPDYAAYGTQTRYAPQTSASRRRQSVWCLRTISNPLA